MNTKQFQYVLTLAREGSFSKAADTLNITQPSLSQYIKKIEREDVYVDLVSGMSLKLSVDNLFIYDESRVSTQNTDDNKKAE